MAAFKKDKLSWDAVIKKARMYQLGPDKVGALLDKFYEDDLNRGFSIQTFVLVAMYKDRLSKLKRRETIRSSKLDFKTLPRPSRFGNY